MNKYTQAAKVIIGEQRLVIGPLALDLAKKVRGISFANGSELDIVGDPKNVLQQLVGEYSKIFGRTSIEVSKEAIKRNSLLFQPGELPDILLS
jgi:hypothetical protein